MRKPGGYATLTAPDGKIKEIDTVTCKHCNTIMHVKPFMDPADMGGLCKVCMGFICPKCVGGACDEVQRKLDRMEASYHARRSYGI